MRANPHSVHVNILISTTHAEIRIYFVPGYEIKQVSPLQSAPRRVSKDHVSLKIISPIRACKRGVQSRR